MKLTTTDDAVKAAQLLERRALLIVTTIHTAMRRLTDARGGFSATASGADAGGGGQRTITVDGDQVPVTGVEADALSPQEDRSITDRADLLDLLDRACDDAIRASEITARYFDGTVSTADLIASRRVTAMWCPNPGHGQSLQPRGNGLVHCRWCADFQRAEKQLPPAELCELHDTGKRISTDDVDRALERGKYKAAAKAARKKRAKRPTAHHEAA